VTLPARQSYVPWVSNHSFVLSIQSQQGNAGELQVAWDMLDTPAIYVVRLNFGAGLVQVARVDDVAYPTGTPYDSGVRTWDVGGGTVRVSLSGNENP
jgi:hypothetical protein